MTIEHARPKQKEWFPAVTQPAHPHLRHRILAALAGFSYLFLGFRILGFDWFGLLGDLPAFNSVGIWGWLAIFVGIIWILVAFGLWALQPWARRLR